MRRKFFSTLPPHHRITSYMDENWPLFQPMKLVSISTNGIHPRIKTLPINRLRGILAKKKEFQRSLFQSQIVERIGVKQSGLSHRGEWQET